MDKFGSQNGSTGPRRVTGKALFNMGVCVGTPGATRVMEKHGLHPLMVLARHGSGDWGTLCPEDFAANEEAVKTGDRIMSVYKHGPKGEEDTLWVITDPGHETTTILLPDEY